MRPCNGSINTRIRHKKYSARWSWAEAFLHITFAHHFSCDGTSGVMQYKNAFNMVPFAHYGISFLERFNPISRHFYYFLGESFRRNRRRNLRREKIYSARDVGHTKRRRETNKTEWRRRLCTSSVINHSFSERSVLGEGKCLRQSDGDNTI